MMKLKMKKMTILIALSSHGKGNDMEIIKDH